MELVKFHMLFLDGFYTGGTNLHPVRFRRVKTPTKDELTKLTRTITTHVARHLERQGLLERDTGRIYGVVVTNISEFKAFLENDFAAVPDSVQEIDIIFGGRDYVAMHAIYIGSLTVPVSCSEYR